MGEPIVHRPVVGTPDLHPAVRAWRRLERPEPVHAVTELTLAGKPLLNSQVYRISRGDGRPAVIAKRAARPSLAVETTIYRAVLPGWVGLPGFLGASDDDTAADQGWLFLEEISGERFGVDTPGHPEALARTLAELHRTTIGWSAPRDVPAVGNADRQLTLELALERLAVGLANPFLTDDELDELTRARGVVRQVKADWSRLVEVVDEGPICLVHGDLIGKNIVVTSGRAVLLDWASAAWGCPAEDLADVDVPTYASGLDLARPWADIEGVTNLGHAGSVLRDLSLIQATATGLTGQWVSRSVRNIGFYANRIAARWAQLR